MSGIDLPDGRIIRKGAVNAVVRYVADDIRWRRSRPTFRRSADVSRRKGATPLAISVDGDILGVIVLVGRAEARHPSSASRNCATWASAPSW